MARAGVNEVNQFKLDRLNKQNSMLWLTNGCYYEQLRKVIHGTRVTVEELQALAIWVAQNSNLK